MLDSSTNRSRRGSGSNTAAAMDAAREAEEAALIQQIRELQARLTKLTFHSQDSLGQSLVSSPQQGLSASTSPNLTAPHGNTFVRGRIERKSSTSPTSVRTSKQTDSSLGPAQRLVIVANRLPLSLQNNPDSGEWAFKVSSGGLVSAITSIKDLPMLWVGWPGAIVDDIVEREKISETLGKSNYVPVWMPKNVADRYYNGYSNAVLWPLFHYIPLPMQDLYSSTGMWEAYEEANRLFASTVLKHLKRGDVVWVHDYHLMLLPGMLRAGRPRLKIGFFLHIPFPSSEIYRVLPQREEILQGLLSSNLVGIHIYDYARHFKSACIRILGVEATANRIDHGSVSCAVGTFPIGIDAEKFIECLETDEVKQYISELQEQFKGKKVIVGIDRLDYIKGIPHKLYAMERFFEENSDWVGKVVLIQIAVPSRTDVKEYQRLARETHEIVGRINGRFGSLASVPIHYLDQSIPFPRMCALYRVADVCINTSLRDGMNLVSYEYVACQQGKSGVLILSEFAGACQSLGAGCIRINPWDVKEVASAIREALTMSEDERQVYHSYSSQYVLEHSAQNWADSFVTALDRCVVPDIVEIIPPKLNFDLVCENFVKTEEHRLIILGLVGTLTQSRKEGVAFDLYTKFAKISPELTKAIQTITRDPHSSVLIVTSRNQENCERTCCHVGAYVAAENGYFLQDPTTDEWINFYGDHDLSWMDDVEEVLQYFCDRTPYSFVEREKSYLSWHYKDCDSVFGDLQARDLLNHLNAGPLVNTSTEVIHSNKLVQIRPAGVSKGHTLEKVVQLINSKESIGFILCLGNFLFRDEDMFLMLDRRTVLDARSPKNISPLAYIPDHASIATVTIGARASSAKSYIRNSSDVQNLLSQMALAISKGVSLPTLRFTEDEHKFVGGGSEVRSPSVDSSIL